ncbi:hypothetical protein PR202_ga16105 [Eleusine coracana subsp. coracana]|uniref:WRKY domain-containing protein n=1 Tax=Eleusine coracana subsp. coracana TaxID=191504 RepID=A0AAV5CLY1_ELECO|nr:hypothetical protein QOZ80_6AG0532580 [Eleusine coracana subsp. coracana]GJM99043.1 hypothetical protein PR202_ga16105 [Eleusine coracana subsp. coracana]
MESFDANGGSRLVVTELSHIKELVMQLEEHLGGSHDLCKLLASQIFSTIERSIGIITSSNFDSGPKRSAAVAGLADGLKTTKKRKMTEKMKNQVKVSSAGGGETPVDDGHSWRKYGQKEILGAKYPRGYYRCTYRHSQGCAAMKQVQRTEEDPTIFNVFYLGTHTCVPKTEAAAGKALQERNPEASGTMTVKTEGLAVAGDSKSWSAATTPFCKFSTPGSVCVAPEHSPFSAPSTSENWPVSPATSNSYHNTSFSLFHASEWRAQSELQEVVSALVVASTPPVPAMDVTDELLDVVDIDVSSFLA